MILQEAGVPLTLLSELPSTPLSTEQKSDPDTNMGVVSESNSSVTTAVVPAVRETGSEVISSEPSSIVNDSTDPVLPIAIESRGYCYRIGFENLEEMRTWRDYARLNVWEELGYDEEESSKVRFWLLIPPFPDQEMAINHVEWLGDQGIEDLYRVREGDYLNAISLGVYSRRESVDRRKAQLLEINAKEPFEVVRLEVSTTRYWQTFHAAQPLPQEMEEFTAIHHVNKGDLQTISCP